MGLFDSIDTLCACEIYDSLQECLERVLTETTFGVEDTRSKIDRADAILSAIEDLEGNATMDLRKLVADAGLFTVEVDADDDGYLTPPLDPYDMWQAIGLPGTHLYGIDGPGECDPILDTGLLSMTICKGFGKAEVKVWVVPKAPEKKADFVYFPNSGQNCS